MATRKTVAQVDKEQDTTDAKVEHLTELVDDLIRVVVFLADNPQYNLRDYLKEAPFSELAKHVHERD